MIIVYTKTRLGARYYPIGGGAMPAAVSFLI